MHYLALLAALTIFSLTAHAEPPPGHPTTQDTMRMMGVDKANATTLSGTVAEALDSNSYTYVRVTLDQGERWLAIPQTPLKVGDRVRLADGHLMQNFYSKTLQRTFPEIYFLNGVELVK